MRISDWSSDVCSSDLMARIGSEGGTEIIIPGISHAATESQEGGMVNPASRQGYAGSLGQKSIERLGERLGLIEHDEVEDARYHLSLEGRDVRIQSEERRVGQESVGTFRYRSESYLYNKQQMKIM